MTYLRLFWLFFRIGVLNELEYRANFLIQLITSLLGLGSAIAGLAVVFSHTHTLRGWRPEEILAILGIHSLVRGAINLVLQPSMQRLMEDVRQGTLDFVLTKPEDSQMLVSLRQVEIWRMIDVFLGLGVLTVALVRLEARVGVGQVLAFTVALLAGGAIIYSFLLFLATCTFWFIRVENILVVFQSMYEAGRWPVGIYPPWLQLSLTFLVPVAFAVTVPAEALVGRLTIKTLIGAIALALILLIATRWFWKLGLRYYSGASA